MSHRTDDVRVKEFRPLLPAAILQEELPLSDGAADLVWEARGQITAALRGTDKRIVVVVGPCSIHDPQAALEYAEKLKASADKYADSLLIVMRVYFEKPRTTVGWKGFVNDPFLDGSYRVNQGLRLARKLLLDIAEVGLPSGTEFLDTTLPQHLADLVSWGAIGARTTESQTHREMASGLSMPVGFKNTTDGGIQTAVDAIVAAASPHWFAGATKDGLSALVRTTGNDACHLILRGGTRTGPNYHAANVEEVSSLLAKRGLPQRIMVDFSHGNSAKNHRRQAEVAESVATQIEAGAPIFGVMIESHLVGGRQDEPHVYGQSITDGCLSFEETLPILERLAKAAQT